MTARLASTRARLLLILVFSVLLAGCSIWPFTEPPEVPIDEEVEAPELDYFTVVVLPDTQYYSESHPDVFHSQADWIVENAEEHNIVMVLHEGDVVNKGAKQIYQWNNARAALRKIDEAGIPLFIAIGNHDYDDEAETRNSSYFNMYFGIDRYLGQPWFGGAYKPDQSDNVYGIIEAAGRRYLILVLEFGPRKDVVQWANQVVAEHPDHEVILLTHNHLTASGQQSTRLAGSRTYGVEVDAHTGKQLWDALISKHPNFIMVLNGHVTGRASRRIDYGPGGPVHQLMANYQFDENGKREPKLGGEGYLRIMTFRPKDGTIRVHTYSPYLDSYLFDSKNYFLLDYPGVQSTMLPMAQ